MFVFVNRRNNEARAYIAIWKTYSKNIRIYNIRIYFSVWLCLYPMNFEHVLFSLSVALYCIFVTLFRFNTLCVSHVKIRVLLLKCLALFR